MHSIEYHSEYIIKLGPFIEHTSLLADSILVSDTTFSLKTLMY